MQLLFGIYYVIIKYPSAPLESMGAGGGYHTPPGGGAAWPTDHTIPPLGGGRGEQLAILYVDCRIDQF